MRLSLKTCTRHLSVVVLATASFSCSQYDYSSPDPGIIDVRLKVVNNRQDLMPFTSTDSLGQPQNQLYFLLNTLEASQSNDVRLPIYSDVYAIRRNPDGDEFNCLDVQARDSLTILGQAYAPPQTFSGLEMTIDSPDYVFISYGFYGSTIPVTLVLPFVALQQLEATIPVESGRTTRVTVAFDLDLSLIQQTESFLFTPVFYISSVVIL